MTEIPIIQLFGHLLVPLQGDIGDSQAESLRERVLARLKAEACESLIIDTSGIWVLDSHLCSVLASLATAARLMGSRSILCGMTPEMVMTLHAMGIELSSVSTAINLENALHKLGYKLVKRDALAAPGNLANRAPRDRGTERLAAPRPQSGRGVPEVLTLAEVARKVALESR